MMEAAEDGLVCQVGLSDAYNGCHPPSGLLRVPPGRGSQSEHRDCGTTPATAPARMNQDGGIGLMSSAELSGGARRTLRKLARRAIVHGLQCRQLLAIRPNDYAAHLLEPRACFVTLERQGKLRGCMGHLSASQPLVHDVIENAFAAAFSDPRFPALSFAEMKDLSVHISVLGPAQPMRFKDQQDLIAQLRPGVDGLILHTPDDHPVTLLPAAWSELPEAHDFLRQLKQKAGLGPDDWPDNIRVERYTTEAF